MSKILILLLISIVALIGYVLYAGEEGFWDHQGTEEVKKQVPNMSMAQTIVRVGATRNAYQHKLIDTYKRSMELGDHDATCGVITGNRH